MWSMPRARAYRIGRWKSRSRYRARRSSPSSAGNPISYTSSSSPHSRIVCTPRRPPASAVKTMTSTSGFSAQVDNRKPTNSASSRCPLAALCSEINSAAQEPTSSHEASPSVMEAPAIVRWSRRSRYRTLEGRPLSHAGSASPNRWASRPSSAQTTAPSVAASSAVLAAPYT